MMKRTAEQTWQVVHHERHLLIADLEHVGVEQWFTPSLCPGWDVHDVLAHLVDTAQTTRVGFIRRMVAARFDFDRDNAVGLAQQKAADPKETLTRFRAVSQRTSTPPAALATRLVEAFVHGEDIRRPLGIASNYPPEHVATALAYQLKAPLSMGGGKEPAQGWRLVATDVDFHHDAGDGADTEVRAKAIMLLLAVSGRPVPAAEFSGGGAAAFTNMLEQRR